MMLYRQAMRQRRRWRLEDFIINSIISLLAYFGSAFWIMIAIGVAHSYDSRIPPFGYGASWWLSFAVLSLIQTALVLSTLNDHGPHK